MKIITPKNRPHCGRDNIRSYLLVAESTVGAKHMTTSLVEMDPGGIQKLHRLGFTGSMMTKPSSRLYMAPPGAFFMQGGSSQCMHGVGRSHT